VRIHLATEHALELEPAHRGFEVARFAPDFARRRLVVFRLGELEQLGGIRDGVRSVIELRDVGAEPRPLLAELLRALLVRPDSRVLELAVYFFEPLDLDIVLKETPVANGCALRGL
jgi:hypothetical protein